ncbi:MAG: hypothetical protein ACODAQ_12425 [Phycisphaeraceae bacterium]
MSRTTHTTGFTILELAVVLCVLVVLTVFFTTSRRMGCTLNGQVQSNNQLRGIHQNLFVYGYEHETDSNSLYFPGLDKTGQPTDLTVENRFHLMLDDNLYSPDYLISPKENTGKSAWSAGPFTDKHYSYAMLQVPKEGGRYDEWQETLNADAIVLSDRNTGRNTTNQISSLQTQPNSGQWEGGVCYNDNHVTTEDTTHFETKYGGIHNKHDHLFEPTGRDDAYLIHRGN